MVAARRYYRYLPGVPALILYGVNSLMDFRQVLRTPLFLVLLGICERCTYKDLGVDGRSSAMKGNNPYEMGKI